MSDAPRFTHAAQPAHTGADAAVARPAVRPTAPLAPAPGSQTRIPHDAARRTLAAARTCTAFSAPRATEFLTADLSATTELLRDLPQHRAFAGVRIGPLLLLARATLLALRARPALGDAWDGERGEIIRRPRIRLALTSPGPRGALTPVIPAAETLGLRALADAIESAEDRAADGTVSAEDTRPATLTLTDFGAHGIDSATPPLGDGQAAAIGLGRIRPRAWMSGADVAVRDVGTLSLTIDHRLTDGDEGAAFLADIARMLGEPNELLARS